MADVDVSLSNSLNHKSPLDSLARQSSRRAHRSPQQPPQEALTSPRHGHDDPGASRNHNRFPSSPLLHTRFRTSASTGASAENSFMDLRGDYDPEDDGGSSSSGQEVYWSREDGSVYSTVSDSPSYSPPYDTPNFAYVVDAVGDSSPTLPPSPTPSSPSAVPDYDRQSWISHGSGDTLQENNRQSTSTVRDTWRSSGGAIDPFTFREYESPRVPTVVVSSPSSNFTPREPPMLPTSSNPGHNETATRPSAIQYSISNFSRPIRPPTVVDERNKREVLERNRSPRRSESPSSFPPQQYDDYRPYEGHHASPSPQQRQAYHSTSSPATQDSPQYYSDPPDSGWAESNPPVIYRSASANAAVSNSNSPPIATLGRSVSSNAVPSSSRDHVRLPNAPPSPRPASKLSLYSTYSFYQLEDGSRTSSPSSPHLPSHDPHPQSTVNTNANANRSRSRPSPSPSPSPTKLQYSMTPDDYLILGIQHHEGNRLAESATCFERAATIDGGCGVGMLMWGLSLRHAWGTPKDEKAAFRWLRRAAEAAVGDLEAAREGRDQKAVRTELVLAIYEVGQCFFHGWGVPQDKKMAVSYFQVAARLGDCDAQQELGYCLANGKGCKKNLKEAAKWYRAAAAQGASTVGLAWIYKPKYT